MKLNTIALVLLSSTLTSFATDVKTESATSSKLEAAKEFTYTIFIAKDIKTLWHALVTKKVVDNYFMCPLTTLELKKGGVINYAQGMISGKVLEVEKEKKFCHSFKFAHDKTGEVTKVTYELEAIGGVTHLQLTHSGFKKEGQAYADITGGWPVIMSQLKTYLETGKKMPWPKK